MSDGERAVLYLIVQVLCIPDNKKLIIDEPELHLHGSIMNRLFTRLNNESSLERAGAGSSGLSFHIY